MSSIQSPMFSQTKIELALEAIEHLERANHDGSSIKNPIPRASYPRLFTLKRAKPIIRMEVPLSKVYTNQKYIGRHELVGHITGERLAQMFKPLPLVFYHNGRYYIKNGNHRILAAILKKENALPMRVARM